MKTTLALLLALLVGCGSADRDDGVNGVNGPSGSTGTKGEKGDKGDPGVPGLNGSAAMRGDPGPQGATGATGPQGVAGSAGAPGEDAAQPIVVASPRLKPEYVTYKYTSVDGASYTMPLMLSGTWFDTVRNESCERVSVMPGATINDGKWRCLPRSAWHGPYNPNDYMEMSATTIVYSH